MAKWKSEIIVNHLLRLKCKVYLQNFHEAFNLAELIQDTLITYLHPALNKLTRFNYLIPPGDSL